MIKGTVRADSRAPGGYEIDVIDAEVLQEVHDYPITPKEHGTEFLMDHRHLWLRSRRQHAVLKVRHTVVKAVGISSTMMALRSGFADLYAGGL